MSDRPMFRFLGGPWDQRLLPPGNLPRELRVPMAQPLTLNGGGGVRIARYTRPVVGRDDLFLFEGWEGEAHRGDR